jgi:hypothetical protein
MAKSDISQAQAATTGAIGTAQQQAAGILGQAVPGYSAFAQTGGISPQQQALTRQQAQQSVAGITQAMQQNLARQKAIQGGYSPGFAAGEANIARQGGAAAGEAVNAANLGLLQQIQQGRLAGLGGLAGIGGEYLGQIPSLLGTQAQLAEAKPSWQQLWGTGAGVVGDIGSALAGI